MELEPLGSRRSVMWARSALLVAVLAGLTACTGSGGVDAPATSMPPTVTTSPTDTDVISPVGYPMQSPKCPTKPTAEPDQPPVAVTGQVRAYLLCQAQAGVWGTPFAPYRLTPSAPNGGKPFAGLDAALRLPDEPPSGGGCPAVGQIPVTIYIETSEGHWWAHIPVDGCGLYLPQVQKALSKIAVPM